MNKKDYYEILNVNKNATESEIKKQYKKLAKEYHPDKQRDESKIKDCEEKLKEINEAYSVLSDKNKRNLYDQFGHDFDKVGQNYNANQNHDDMYDFIRRTHEQFFGNNQPQNIIRINASLTLNEMYYGANKKFKYTVDRVCSHCLGLRYDKENNGHIDKCSSCNGTGIKYIRHGNALFGQTCNICNGTGEKIINPCNKCNGTGLEKIEKTIDVEFPKGIFNGGYLSFIGMGNEVIINNKNVIGDLIVVVNEIKHDTFTRDGDNLHMTLKVPIIDSILGGDVTINTINDKKHKFKLKVGTEAGEIYRLSNLGMPIIDTDNYGHLYVHIKHIMPTKLSENEIMLLNELNKTISYE